MSSPRCRNTVQEWDEKLEQCPYNPSHQVRADRFGNHLVRCRESLSKQPTSPYYYKIDEYEICKFNSLHHLPKNKMKDHYKKCESSITVLKAVAAMDHVYEKKSGISDIMSGVDFVNAGGNADEDDWEDDAPVPAYDPTVKASQLPMHLPPGLTPAERRNHRMAKRQGLLDSYEPPAVEVPVGTNMTKKKPAGTGRGDSTKPRPPPTAAVAAAPEFENKFSALKMKDNDEWETIPVKSRGRGKKKNH